jgi:hypothetical protein
MRNLVFALCLLLTSNATLAASTAASPKQIVQGLYKPYVTNPDQLGGPSALELILPYASKSLKKAILKEEECQRRTQEICTIDFDIIINGQDWDISKLTITEGTKNSLPVVSATFLNFSTKNKVIYSFVREKGVLKIDDVETISYENGSKGEGQKLKEILNQDI